MALEVIPVKKWFLPLLLALWPYLFFLILLHPESVLLSFVVAYCAATVPVYLANFLFAFRCKGLGIPDLARWDLIIKACHIPFYLLVFLAGAFLALAIVAPAVLFMAVMVIPVLVVVDVLLMLTSSCYGFSAIRRAKADGLIEDSFAEFHTLLHFFFVADVISAFLLRRNLKEL